MAKPKIGNEDKLTKKEVKKLAELYDLGEVKNWKYVSGGLINYNFDVRTDKGDFMVRRLGYTLTKYWGKQKTFEYSVVNYLHKKKLPYMIPDFMKNRHGKYISTIGKSLFEVYPKIPGEKFKNYNDKKLKEVAKAAAIFHKTIKGYKGKAPPDDFKWMFGKFKQVEKLKPNTPVNRLALKNLKFFENLLRHLLEQGLQEDLVIGHRDMNHNNLLFDGDRLVGILDFENLGRSPKMNDLAYTLDEEKPEKWGTFLKEYRKYNPLLKEEERKLIPFMLVQKCSLFWWHALGMRKTPELKYNYLRYTVNHARRLFRMAKAEKGWKF